MSHGVDLRYRVRDGVLHRVVGEEVFVLMPNGRVHWLKRPSARCLWEALAAGGAGASAEQLTAALVRRFTVASETARADTERFVRELVDKGVLEAAGP